MTLPEHLSQIQFDQNGLIPAIIQDCKTNKVLMLGYMNQEAFLKTLKGPHVCFYSRSRQKLWVKGETSGHYQNVKDVRLDCDQDAVLVLVEQTSAPCHKGYGSCFYKSINEDDFTIVEEKYFDPNEVYKK